MTTIQKKVKTKEDERTASTSTGSEIDSEVGSAAGGSKKVRRDEGPLLLKRGATGTVDFFSRRSSKFLLYNASSYFDLLNDIWPF